MTKILTNEHVTGVDIDALRVLLNCAEADLLESLAWRNLDSQDDDPAAQTVRDLHAALKEIETGHACQVDNDE